MRRKAAALIDDGYFELVREFPLKALQSEAELDRATAVINRLIDRGIDKLSAGEDAYLDVLSDLTKKYEIEHHPIPEADPVDVLQFLMEDRGVNQRAVAMGSGIAVSTMSEIVAGRRQLNLEHMQKLAQFFEVPVSAFVSTSKPATTRRVRKARRTTK